MKKNLLKNSIHGFMKYLQQNADLVETQLKKFNGEKFNKFFEKYNVKIHN